MLASVAWKPKYLKMAAERWLETLEKASKTAVIQDGKRKVHYLLEDGREMVEEYSMETNVLVRRAWREKGNLGQDTGWNVEIGDPEPRRDNIEVYGIQESSSTPFITRRITKTSLEWRIRNLPYPEDVYSVTVEDAAIIVRTSNKKYFKKLLVPDLQRIGLQPEADRVSFAHRHNTLIITYKKPQQLLELEKKILTGILQRTAKQDRNVECPTS